MHMRPRPVIRSEMPVENGRSSVPVCRSSNHPRSCRHSSWRIQRGDRRLASGLRSRPPFRVAPFETFQETTPPPPTVVRAFEKRVGRLAREFSRHLRRLESPSICCGTRAAFRPDSRIVAPATKRCVDLGLGLVLGKGRDQSPADRSDGQRIQHKQREHREEWPPDPTSDSFLRFVAHAVTGAPPRSAQSQPHWRRGRPQRTKGLPGAQMHGFRGTWHSNR